MDKEKRDHDQVTLFQNLPHHRKEKGYKNTEYLKEKVWRENRSRADGLKLKTLN
ncbi:MAG: hypothetical protein K6F49_04510 [Saccharofermentans sp.]|nr:hypothetical protein [Saccharofermentans sp.]